ncbi:hypothetical protein BVRB_7g163720 [Beta vulgaris subsp. vulgaris]|nr:hypothetical protein BVRB_7g163720 [Beta vulgaris subsp. vulgaris]
MTFAYQNKSFFFVFLVLHISVYILVSHAYDPKCPPKSVNEVCNRSGKELYMYCIALFNTGSVENGDMRFLAYYTRDFAENNATNALEWINSTLVPSLPDSYIQEVLNVCKDAFTRLKDELVNRVNPMIVENVRFQEAKAWVNYGIGFMDSCKAVCNAKPQVVCPLKDNIRDTQGVLKLLAVVLELLTEGVM